MCKCITWALTALNMQQLTCIYLLTPRINGVYMYINMYRYVYKYSDGIGT